MQERGRREGVQEVQSVAGSKFAWPGLEEGMVERRVVEENGHEGIPTLGAASRAAFPHLRGWLLAQRAPLPRMAQHQCMSHNYARKDRLGSVGVFRRRRGAPCGAPAMAPARAARARRLPGARHQRRPWHTRRHWVKFRSSSCSQATNHTQDQLRPAGRRRNLRHVAACRAMCETSLGACIPKRARAAARVAQELGQSTARSIHAGLPATT